MVRVKTWAILEHEQERVGAIIWTLYNSTGAFSFMTSSYLMFDFSPNHAGGHWRRAALGARQINTWSGVEAAVRQLDNIPDNHGH